MKLRNVDDVEAYLRTFSTEDSETRRWQVIRTATRHLLKQYGVPSASRWKIEPLPHQATTRYGDCTPWTVTIRYRKEHVRDWWTVTLASTIVHEVAHAVTAHERRLRGRGGVGGHGPMWRGVAAAMGLRSAQSNNLPKPSSTTTVAASMPVMDVELRYRIGVHRIMSHGQEQCIRTHCGACGQTMDHYLPFAEGRAYADSHATPGNLASCSTLEKAS